MNSQRASVLVVDDDPILLRSLTRVLGKSFTVTPVSRADDAVNLIAGGRRFDVILSDVWMPGTDGQGLYDEIRALSPRQAEHMMFLSGGGLPHRLGSFLAEHVVVDKPFELARLEAAILDVAAHAR
jgi:CheY-like chemotaxis protein